MKMLAMNLSFKLRFTIFFNKMSLNLNNFELFDYILIQDTDMPLYFNLLEFYLKKL